MKIRPSEGASSPAIMRSGVVFPHPLGPSSVVNVPGWIEKLTSRTAVGALGPSL
jgi:hypothetical protein